MNALNLFGGSGKVGQLMAAIARVLIPKEPSPYCTGLSFTPDHCLDRHSRKGGNPLIKNNPRSRQSSDVDELSETLSFNSFQHAQNKTGLTS